MTMATIGTGLRSARIQVKKWGADPGVRLGLSAAAHILGGFVLSAASLYHRSLPLAAAAVCGMSGWQGALVALGGGVGYLTYWGQEGIMGLTWIAAALIAALAVGDRQMTKAAPLLMPSISALILAGSGLGFQILLGDDTPTLVYILRIVLAAGVTRLTAVVTTRRSPIADWLAGGFWVLALVQALPVQIINPGFIMAGFLAAGRAFPAAALAGLALDLAQVSAVPMTAALTMAWLMSLFPGSKLWMKQTAGAVCYLIVMGLSGVWQPWLAVPLGIGGLSRCLYRGNLPNLYRRGETGVLQVRLEMAAAVMNQTGQILREAREPPVDEDALISRCTQAACTGCSCRKSCLEKDGVLALPGSVLHRELLSKEDLPVPCRRGERLLQELRRGQEQLRLHTGYHARQQECVDALVQQYAFLESYLQGLSDSLSRRLRPGRTKFQPKVAVYANRKESENADRCSWFAGTEDKYYVVLCDGMGTGLGAVEEGMAAMSMVKKLLTAGFPAEYALRSLNSLCALRSRAGAATVDVAELDLVSGKVTLYKWGSAPSWLLSPMGAKKIGTATPPPGLSIRSGRETVEKLSLRRGETLVLLSDGVGGEDAIASLAVGSAMPPGEVAAEILELSTLENGDDATVAVVRLASA